MTAFLIILFYVGMITSTVTTLGYGVGVVLCLPTWDPLFQRYIDDFRDERIVAIKTSLGAAVIGVMFYLLLLSLPS